MRDSRDVFSENLRTYLNSRGIRQGDMADSLGIPRSTVSNWLRKIAYPRPEVLEKVAAYFGVDKTELIRDHSHQSVDVPALFAGLSRVVNDERYTNYAQALYDMDEPHREQVYTYIDFVKSQS